MTHPHEHDDRPYLQCLYPAASQGIVAEDDPAPRLHVPQPQRPSTPGDAVAPAADHLNTTITSALRPATGAVAASYALSSEMRDGCASSNVKSAKDNARGAQEWETGIADKGVVGRALILRLIDTWGDANYMGLTGIKVQLLSS